MNKKIEEKVNSSFTNATPDMSNSVINDCQNTTVARPVKSTTRNTNWVWKFVTFALALVLVVTGLIGGIGTLTSNAETAVVTLDVNPSIEIHINGKNRIKQIIPKNEKAVAVVGDPEDFKGVTLDFAIKALIGGLVESGYIADFSNSVLVSVETDKEKVYNQLVEQLVGKIDVVLKDKQIDSSVVTQWLKDTNDLKEFATQNNISVGKAQLIAKIVEASVKANQADPTATVYDAEELALRSTNELSILLAKLMKEGYLEDGPKQDGEASQKKYISTDKALEIALAKVGITDVIAENIPNVVKMDFENGAMVYEVEILYGGYEYELDIDALNGAVLSFEQEVSDYDFDDDEVTKTNQELVEVALSHAGVDASAVVTEGGAKIERYKWMGYAVVYFETADFYYEIELTLGGKLIYKAEIPLADLASDYATRDTVETAIKAKLNISDLELDQLKQLRIYPTLQDVDGEMHLVYKISFEYMYSRYTGTYDEMLDNPLTLEVAESVSKDDIWNKHFGDGFPFDGELQWDDGKWEYEYCDGGYKYEFEFDRWGNLISQDKELIQDDDDHNGNANLKVNYTETQVKQFLSTHFGIDFSSVTEYECELEVEFGRVFYEISFKMDGKKCEIVVDANSCDPIYWHGLGFNGDFFW